MIPLDEARAEVLAGCRAKPPEAIGLERALGLVLAEAVVSPSDVPPFPNSAMDGYALRSADVAGASAARPVRLKVIGTVAAGTAATTSVGAGEALRIMTGAPFPPGADGVAIVETTRAAGEGQVEVMAPVSAGDHLRRPGEDIPAGAEVFPAGTTLGPGHLGVLASVGALRVRAHPRPRVGVLSTGDELVDGDAPLRAGQIRDSNRRTLIALLERDGFDPLDLGIAADDEADIERRLRRAAADCDAVLTSGGVSMGDFDFIKVVLDRIGRMRWMQVAIRPAKPFTFGVVGATPVFGLPGNPVSSMVSYELLARPGLRRLAGQPAHQLVRPEVPAVLDDDRMRAAPDGRTCYYRAVSGFGDDGRLHVKSAGGQGSHQLHAMARADSLAVVPPGEDRARGDSVAILRLVP